MLVEARRRRRRGAAEVNITPLIDVVFILLIFFLITATFVENPGIQVNLPKASSAPQTAEANKIVLSLTTEGMVIVSGKSLSRDELRATLAERQETQADAVIIIQADADAPHGNVVELMDIAREVGFSRLAIATEAER